MLIKCSLFFLGFFQLNCIISAQNGYNILYKATMADYGFGASEIFTRVVYNNYLAYIYSFPQGAKDPMGEKTNYGAKPQHHSTIIKKSSGDRFYYYGLKGYKFYWALDSNRLKTPVWNFTAETKEILGHQCKRAYWLNEYLIPLPDSVKTWRVDSIIIWYATDIKSDYPIFNYAGLPGLPLEILDGNRRWHTKALWMAKETIFIDEPKNIMPIEKLRKHSP